MQKSESINELATALSKAQAEFTTAKKLENNPYYNSKYADIAALLNVIQQPMATNGLCIVQLPRTDIPAQTVTVETVLCHSSGQWISESYSVPAVSFGQGGRIKFDAQSIGSAITYARRYALQSFLCLAAEDDDGNSISQYKRVEATTPIMGQPEIPTAIEVEPQAAEVTVVKETKKRGPKPKSAANSQSTELPVVDKSTLPENVHGLEVSDTDLPFALTPLAEDREPTAAEKKSFADDLLLYADKVDRGSLRDFFLNLAGRSDPRELTYNDWVLGFSELSKANGDTEKLKNIVSGSNK